MLVFLGLVNPKFFDRLDATAIRTLLKLYLNVYHFITASSL